MTGFRRKTKVVTIGGVPLGGDYPVRIQSMTNTSTLDTNATVEQIIALHRAGSHYVRMTVMSLREAENLAEIKKMLNALGIEIPLVADVHFNPSIAKTAARIVEKVRINPGNFGGILPAKEYSEQEFISSFEKARKEFVELLDICKKHKTALRIGVNHGSLSPRMISKFGDTPEGMVESAMEFLHICEEMNFHNVVVSLKSSNTRLMILANLLMAGEMDKAGMNYPLHLGVTEAGSEEDGRVKSAAGIGLLLVKGIGDTIRVSLTEDSVREIPVARKLVEYYACTKIAEKDRFSGVMESISDFRKRTSGKRANIGGSNPPVVMVSAHGEGLERLLHKKDQVPDYLFAQSWSDTFSLPSGVGVIQNYSGWLSENQNNEKVFPILTAQEYSHGLKKSPVLNFIQITAEDISKNFTHRIQADETAVLVSVAEPGNGYWAHLEVFEKLRELNCDVPVIISQYYREIDFEAILLKSAVDAGGLFMEGMGDGIWLHTEPPVDIEKINSVSFSVLQAARARISKTEFISCPSCGRTMFPIEEVTARVKSRMSHLKGLKIAVMGCIVNGPGEMADADYGYIGGPGGRVNLYKGKKLVKKDIPADKALDELVRLIKDNRDWTNPE